MSFLRNHGFFFIFNGITHRFQYTLKMHTMYLKKCIPKLFSLENTQLVVCRLYVMEKVVFISYKMTKAERNVWKIVKWIFLHEKFNVEISWNKIIVYVRYIRSHLSYFYGFCYQFNIYIYRLLLVTNVFLHEIFPYSLEMRKFLIKFHEK